MKPASPPTSESRFTAEAGAPDLLDRNQIEQKFAALSNELNSLLEQAPFGSHTLDMDGTYLSINAQELTWIGRSRHETIGRIKFTEHLTPDSREKFRNYFPRCIHTPFAESLELELVGSDGAIRYVNLYIAAIQDAEGNSVNCRSVLYDITERRQAEQALRESDQHKDEFLAMLAHELRNPLVPIRNAAHILGCLELDEPRVKWAQQVIETQVGRLSHMVDDLLDVARIAHGKIALKLEDIELNSLLTQIMQSVVTLAKLKRQKLNTHLPQHEVRLRGDSIRLSQAIFNLLDNAIKYTQDGGCIEFAARMAGEEIEISVQDNGMGITAELLPKVFDLFQQDERGLDRAQGGLGIGLTLVQRLIVQHGGRVAAYSTGKGQGATFTVWLPAKAMTAQPAEKETISKRSATKDRRVLVVDDDFAVADSTAMLLELKGYAVCVADSGISALGQVPAFRPQAVLLDIGLHGMDGFEVAKRLRELPEGRDLFVVAVTGYADEETSARALASGCDHFLVKPVDFNVLDGLLDELGDVAQPPSS